MDSDPDSDDDLVIEDQEPPETTPALLCVSKPTDERGRALYDAVQAVWYPRNKPVPAEKIRSAIAAFGETVRGLRDAWKAKNDSLRKAEIPNSPTASQAGQLKEDVARYRQVMESVMARSLLYGHPAIVKRYVLARISPSLCHFVWAPYSICLYPGILEDLVVADAFAKSHQSFCTQGAISTPSRRKSRTRNIRIHSHTFIDSVQPAVLCDVQPILLVARKIIQHHESSI